MKAQKLLALAVIGLMLLGPVLAGDDDEEDQGAQSSPSQTSSEPESDIETDVGGVEGSEDESPDADNMYIPDAGDYEDLPEAVSFSGGADDQDEQTANLEKIVEALQAYEDEYTNCLKEIPDEEFTGEKVDECVGTNYIKVVLDVKYETMKVMARADTKVRQFFIRSCYEPAEASELKQAFTEGCDNMERDTLDILWNGLDFIELLEINKDKYLVEYGKIPDEDHKGLMALLGDFGKEFFELLDEIDSHKDIMIMNLKTFVDERNKAILESAGGPAGPITHNIQIIEQEIDDDNDGEESGQVNAEPASDARRKLIASHSERQKNAMSIAALRMPLSARLPTRTTVLPGVSRAAKTVAKIPSTGFFLSKDDLRAYKGKANPVKSVGRGARVGPSGARSVQISVSKGRRAMLNRLSSDMLVQAHVPFKNVHSVHPVQRGKL